MKVEEIRRLSAKELTNEVAELKNELFNLRSQLATGQLDNSSSIRLIKKDIARAKTILRERELDLRREA